MGRRVVIGFGFVNGEGGDRVWVGGWGLLEFSVRKSDAMSDMCVDLGVQMSDFCNVLVWMSGWHFRREI